MFFFGKSLHDMWNSGVRQLDTKGCIIERYSYKKGLSIYQEADLWTYILWCISRTLILLNMDVFNSLQIRPGWLFLDLSNVLVTWASLLLQLTFEMNFLFLYVNLSPCPCSSSSLNSLVSTIFVQFFFELVSSFGQCPFLVGHFINAFVIIMTI